MCVFSPLPIQTKTGNGLYLEQEEFGCSWGRRKNGVGQRQTAVELVEIVRILEISSNSQFCLKLTGLESKRNGIHISQLFSTVNTGMY